MAKTSGNLNFKKRSWKHVVKIECLGVKIGLRSNNLSLFEKIKENLFEILPINWREISGGAVDHWISFIKDKDGEFSIYKDRDFEGSGNSDDVIYDLIVSKIRATVAEFAADFVFLHAGVVSWKGRGIIIPGKSRAGKTTLVLELTKRNCEYLSDEFAMIDKDGFIHPFPKKLSLRGIIDENRQYDVSIENLGGVKAGKPVPAGFLLAVEYKPGKARQTIKINSSGEGVLFGVANSLSVRQNPKLVLEVLSKVADQSVILETKRGEAAAFAEYFLNFIENLHQEKKRERHNIQLNQKGHY